MQTLFYEDEAPTQHLPSSIFLAGPTVRGSGRTEWRQEAIDWLEAKKFMGTVVVPELRDETSSISERFSSPPSLAPGMRATSYNILAWETACIDNAAVVLFWMPFNAPSEHPASGSDFRPGYTTRAEVTREMWRSSRAPIVLGMPPGALSGSHIRYHAFHRGFPIHASLEETLLAAIEIAQMPSSQCQKCRKIYHTWDPRYCDACGVQL